MTLTASEYQEYIGLAFGLSLGHKKESDEASARIMRELIAHIQIIEETRIPQMKKYLETLQNHDEHEKAHTITSAIASLLEDVRRSRLALTILKEATA